MSTNTLSSDLEYLTSGASSFSATDNSLGNVFDGILAAYRQEGFDAGYKRALADLLAEFPLITREFLRTQSNPSPELRQALRAFEEHLERAAGTSSSIDHLFDGGLGI